MNPLQWFRSSISRRIAGAAAMLTMTIVVCLGAVSYVNMRSLIRQNIRVELRDEASRFAYHIGDLLNAVSEHTAVLASSSLVSHALVDRRGRERYLVPFLRSYRLPEQIPFAMTLCGRGGDLLAANGPSLPGTCRAPLLQDLVLSRGLPFAEIAPRGRDQVLMLAYPVRLSASSAPGGMLVLEAVIDEVFRREMRVLRVRDDLGLTLKCCEDTIWTRAAPVAKHPFSITLSLPHLRPPLDDLRLTIVVDEAADRAFAPLVRLTAVYLTVGLIILLVTLVMARFLARRISAPLQQLIDTANHIAESGPLEIAPEPLSRDEVGALARAFNIMVSRLLRAAEGLEQRVEERTQELQMSEKKYRTLIESVSDWIWEIDASGRYSYSSPRIRDILGYEPEEVSGRTPFDLMPPDEAARLRPQIAAIMEERGQFQGLENVAVHRDGHHVVLETSGVPVFDKNGQWQGYRGIDRDISERKKAEDAREELNRTLQARVREEVAKNREKDRLMMVQGRQAAMGEMLGNIAHQWRQPLNIIGLIVQDLQDARAHGELTQEYLDKSVRRSKDVIQHMSQTIDDFRSFYRPDKEKQAFSLNDVIGRVLSFIEASFRSSSIAIERDLDESVAAAGYPNEFAQVLLNILNNAKDALVERAVPSPRVAIRLRRDGGRAVVTIADNAGGIPERDLDRIFEPYFTTKEEGKGTGIGLYMSKIIIEKNMAGRLTVRNAADGAEFRIEV